MNPDHIAAKAHSYLHTLCSFQPHRRTGSAGNRAATDYLARVFKSLGFNVDATPFACLDHRSGPVSLCNGNTACTVYISPYSLGCNVTAPLRTASTLAELERVSCAGAILLLRGELCAEQLMPKNFPFYNPDHHRQIISLLEATAPAAVITATAKDPFMVGNIYPFPLINDGDFNIPAVHCTDLDGDALAKRAGETFHLTADAERIPVTACNVIARKNPDAKKKLVICAHVDAKEDTPGALDNASGVTVLLLLAELLHSYAGKREIELVAINGEDHYSAAGELDYLQRYGADLKRVALAVNLDGIGFRSARTAWSRYECSAPLTKKIRTALSGHPGLVEGEPWYAGDHMVFVQSGRPALALTCENAMDAVASVNHTPADTPDGVDCTRLGETASALRDLAARF